MSIELDDEVSVENDVSVVLSELRDAIETDLGQIQAALAHVSARLMERADSAKLRVTGPV